MPNSPLQSRGFVGSGRAFPLAPGSAGVLPIRGGIQTPAETPAKRGANGKTAYTLIEVLVVAVVIVLMLGMALPVFRAITGSRSEAGATNIIASMLGRARNDAIGIQQPYGVAFVYNPSTQQGYLAEVYFPTPVGGYPIAATVPPGGYFTAQSAPFNNYYINNSNVTQTYTSSNIGQGLDVGLAGPALDLVPDTDVVPLPAGVGVATICNCTYNGTGGNAPRSSNGYLSVGVILFDGKGRVTSLPYGISSYGKLWQATGLPSTGIGYPTIGTVGLYNSGGTQIVQGVYSQFGLVVFQRDAWLTNRSSQQPEALYTDPQTSPGQALPDYITGSPTQQQTDNWLDQNATPLLIDRYTGTLIRTE
jgi:type II secretory pathway pseudopilin PulG